MSYNVIAMSLKYAVMRLKCRYNLITVPVQCRYCVGITLLQCWAKWTEGHVQVNRSSTFRNYPYKSCNYLCPTSYRHVTQPNVSVHCYINQPRKQSKTEQRRRFYLTTFQMDDTVNINSSFCLLLFFFLDSLFPSFHFLPAQCEYELLFYQLISLD